jgi:hypothetical protein
MLLGAGARADPANSDGQTPLQVRTPLAAMPVTQCRQLCTHAVQQLHTSCHANAAPHLRLHHVCYLESLTNACAIRGRLVPAASFSASHL